MDEDVWKPSTPGSGNKRRAQNQFAATEQRDSTIKQMLKSERAATDAKTAKLRALRIAKEELDLEAVRIAAANAPAEALSKPRRTVKKKPLI